MEQDDSKDNNSWDDTLHVALCGHVYVNQPVNMQTS